VPATQVVAAQVPALAADDCPAIQGFGCVAPSAQEWPAGHAVQALDEAPPRENVPAGHCVVQVAAVRPAVDP